jgi:hypothetical protein
MSAGSKRFVVELLEVRRVDIQSGKMLGNQKYYLLLLAKPWLLSLTGEMWPEQKLAHCQSENKRVVDALSLGVRHYRWAFERVVVLLTKATRSRIVDHSTSP